MPKEGMLTYIDAPDWPRPTSDGLWSERPVVERTRAYTPPAFRARTLVCQCRSCTRYAALGGEDAHYSWSHTARSSHACHRRHPRKTLSREYYLKKKLKKRGKENTVITRVRRGRDPHGRSAK